MFGSGADSKRDARVWQPRCRASGKFLGPVQVSRTKNSAQGRHFLDTSLSASLEVIFFLFFAMYSVYVSVYVPAY
jgi:hypothetical protein